MESIKPLAGCSILVVEDETLIAYGLKDLFEAEGADVHLASTPSEALRLADEFVFSAAVLDFDSNGDESARVGLTLRAYGIPHMYYTGYDDLKETSGAPLLTKPADERTLIATMMQLLRG
jgi:DNA-binding response OmpR family regulator